MRIYIPSSGRHHIQTTAKSIPDYLIDEVVTVVPPHEEEAYKKVNLTEVVAPDIHGGIGPARQWCCEQAEHKVLMLDDDLVFAHRREDDPTKFRPATDDEIDQLITQVSVSLMNYAAVGVATREGGNRDTNNYAYDTRLLRMLAYRTDILLKEKIRFDFMPVMEDFYVALSLLTRGYRNIKINHMVHNQHGSGTVGGCSQYRDKDMQTSAAYQLERTFPDFVTAVKKTTKGAWGGGTRIDVRIQWKKAILSAGEVKSCEL